MKNCLRQFHESYRQVDWDHLLNETSHTLNIAVYYWDKWVREHEAALTLFLKKPDAKIRFFFSNQLSEVQKLFPGNSIAQLEEKIQKTYRPLQEMLKVHQLPLHKVSVHFVPRLLNYSMQCVDDTLLILSFFEMYRQEQVDSPAMIIDLEKSQQIRQFYEKELKGLLSWTD